MSWIITLNSSEAAMSSNEWENVCGFYYNKQGQKKKKSNQSESYGVLPIEVYPILSFALLAF